MALLSSGESSKPQSPQKTFLMGELATTKTYLAQKEEEMRLLEKRLQRLEMARERQPEEGGGSKGGLLGATTILAAKRKMKIGEFTNMMKGATQHHLSKIYFPYVKLPSFSGESDPNIYLGWEAKVEQIFNVYEVQEDQKVKLASLEFLEYDMQWWHQTVMDIVLNKRSAVVS